MFALLLAWHPDARCQPAPGGLRTQDKARAIFGRNVAASFGMKESALVVDPIHENAEPYAALKTGDLWCLSASDRKLHPVARGFSSADGRVAFEGYAGGIGQPGGIAALLEACGVLDKKRKMKTEEIVTRVAWCLNRPAQGEMLYDAKLLKDAGWTPRREDRRPRITLTKGGAEIVYFTMKQGFTGTFDIGKVIVTVAPDYTTTIERRDMPL